MRGYREAGVGGLLLVAVAAVAAINPDFRAAENIRDILIQCVPALIVGCGLTFVILTGEIDISLGSLMGLLAAVLGLVASPARAGMPVWMAVVATLAIGAAAGLLNGVLVTFARVPSIIVTLGMLTVWRGFTELLMGGRWITDLPADLRSLGTGSVYVGLGHIAPRMGVHVPFPILAAAAVVLASVLLARKTRLGVHAYAVGGHAPSAYLAGVSPRRVKLFAFTLMGLLAGVATLVDAPQLSVIESGYRVGFELLVVTCVVVGGTSISGGRGTIVGTVLAVLLLVTIRTMLIFLKLGDTATYWEKAIQGGFILAAVLADHFTMRVPRIRRRALMPAASA